MESSSRDLQQHRGSQEKVDCPQVGGESLHQLEEFKYLWILFTRDGRKEQVTERSPVCPGEERIEQKGEDVDLKVPNLWSRAVGSDRKNEISGN